SVIWRQSVSAGMQRPVAISYAVFALLLVLVGVLHLGTPLVAALFSYLALTKLAFWGKKWIALTLFLVLLVVAFVGGVFFLKRAFVDLPEIVSTAIPVVVRFAEQRGIELPFTDMESLRVVALEGVRDTLGHVGKYLKIATYESVLLVIGVVVAASIFMNPEFEPKRQQPGARPNLYSYYTARIRERFASFYRSFEIVMGAQLIISAINTVLTSIFIYLVGLPYAPVVIMLTFLCGMLPVVGNLISNTIIIGLGFTISPKLALYALVFLVTIHKLEYFLNSRIIGGRIDHPMWLTLLALIIGERLMGISGLILAPIVLSFVKVEMKKIALPDAGLARPVRARRPEPEVAQV
ncbi:MAG TPA: AI-2E family transporter, partial [Chthoniobacterales bacterium]|nr:AI-2E family transporter [Chthoniobacterales bacterium]